MNKGNYLLIKLAEESNECIRELTDVAERCFKAYLFGMDEVQNGQFLNNRERLVNELHDLIATIQMLTEEGVIEYPDNPEKIQAKKDKLNKYYQLVLKNKELSNELSSNCD